MDSFTEKMLERARARQKKLDEHYNIAGETPKMPLKETNTLFSKLENATNLTKSQPNLTECNKLKKKEVASDSNINTKMLYDSSRKENLSDTHLNKYVRQGCTRVSSESSPKSPTKTLNIQQENFNMEIKLTSTDNVRVEVEIEEREESDNDDKSDHKIVGIHKLNSKNKQEETTDKPVIREDAKKRLQRLGKLYSGEDDIQLSSPIHRTEAKFSEESSDKEVLKPNVSCGLSRLKALANTRNEWEDEIGAPNSKNMTKETPKKSWKPPAPKPPVTTNSNVSNTPKVKYPAPPPPTNVNKSKTSSREDSPEKSELTSKSPEKNGGAKSKSPVKDGPTSTETKQLAWDKTVIKSLESQGFTRTNSNARLVYNYKDKGQKEEKSNVISKSVSEIPEEKIEECKEKEEKISATTIVAKLASKFKGTVEDNTEKTQFKPKSPTKGDISNKVAMFEQSSPSRTKDPALLSVSERKALFEKNKGGALIPKAAFGMAAPIKTAEKETPVNCIITAKPSSPTKTGGPTKPVTPTKKMSGKQTSEESPTMASIKQSGGIASKMRALLEKKTTISQSQIKTGIQEQRQKEMDLLLNRYNKQKEAEEVIIEQDEHEEEEDDEENISETTKMIAARAAKIVQFKGSSNEISALPPPPPPPPVKSGAPKRRSKGDSPKVREVLEDVKRIKVSPPKAGRMYPCLSDIEATTETEQEDSTATPSPETSYDGNSSFPDSDGPNTSFGREVLEVVCKNQTPHKRPILNDSTGSETSDVLENMDEYLNEELATEDSESEVEGPTPPKHGKHTPPRNAAATSNSFNYKNYTPTKSVPSKYASPLKERDSTGSTDSSELPIQVVDGENVLPLIHTVSFYRRQQAQGSLTPIRQIVRQPAVEEESPEKENVDLDERLEVQDKIQELLESVSKQQTIISQTSQALNLCVSTIEFSGSSEQVEAEKLLLMATQRRQAALHEVQRLRVEGTLHSGGGRCADKGTLIIADICLPLKREYARALSAAGGLGHHVVCLVKYAEHVMPTVLASTQASPRDNLEMDLHIPGHVKLLDVYSDFTATLEVYTLQAQEEVLPHEVKYHIASKKGANKLTPKKLLKNESRLIMPTVQSPAGPQAVRSPSFQLMGYVVFSLQGISRTQWTLNNTPAMSPLEGSIHMKIKCELAISVEHRGFLSMFEDVSGFGAWHRRWCLLKGNNLSYWKYPEDERKKAPIGSINLQTSNTKLVGPVTREICARPNTFLLETVRAALSTDSDSLVTVCKGERTIVRHLLSADTKDERTVWCEELNKALRAIRFVGNASKSE